MSSGASGTNYSTQDSECFLQPEEIPCSTLDFILTNILKEIFWISTIYMDNYRNTRDNQKIFEPEIINLPDTNANAHRVIKIICSNPCHIENDFTIVTEAFQETFLIHIQNITFSNSKLSLWNVHVMFTNVQFVNSVITDWQPTKGSFGHLVLYFVKTTMENQIVENKGRFGLLLNKSFGAAVSFTECNLTCASIVFKVSHLIFKSNDSSFQSSSIILSVPFISFVTFENVVFTSEIESFTSVSQLNIASNQLNLTFRQCIVNNSNGGINITKQDSGLLNSWMQISFQNCTFHNNSRLGSGAAVEINFFVPEKSVVAGVNFVEFNNSLFVGNRAQRLAQALSEGGAIRIRSSTTHDYCHMLQVHVENSIFTDNHAADGGGALYVSGNCLRTTISNCSFQVRNTTFDSPKGVFIWSSSSISIDSSIFTHNLKLLSPSLLELEMQSDTAEIMKLNLNVHCHKWFRLELEKKFIDQQAKQIKMTCESCPTQFYIPSDGQFNVSLLPNKSDVFVMGKIKDTKNLSCTPCPAGTNCPGNDLTAQPNFWGSHTDHVTTMYQCPTDYCCTTNCDKIDQCSGHRTGVLCGSCAEHHSLSVLFSECVAVGTCKDHWVWPIIVLAATLYMAWYTFKNVIFGILSSFAKKLCKKCVSASDDADEEIDKGYFGIITYFIQVKTVMDLSISLDHTRSIHKVFAQIESYIKLGLNFELRFISNDACALMGLTATDKAMFRLLFLFGVFGTWSLFYIPLSLIKRLMAKRNRNSHKLETFRFKLISGLVEIIKYTYLGFTSVVFYSLTCTSVAGNFVWFHDGSVQCYSIWQISMAIFCLLYIIPYPLLIYLGMRLLKNKKVSHFSFFLATLFPFPVVLYWSMLSCNNDTQGESEEEHKASSEKAIYDGFKGGFRKSPSGTQYWEAVLMLRRLAISATILIPNALIQLSVCSALCIAFLFHHAYVRPFRHSMSNLAEGLSLSLLCGVASVNLIKASFLYAEFSPQGPQVEILRNLKLMELMGIVILIVLTICFEAGYSLAKRLKKASVKPSDVSSHQLFSDAHENDPDVKVETHSSKEDLQVETFVHDDSVSDTEKTEKVVKIEVETNSDEQ